MALTTEIELVPEESESEKPYEFLDDGDQQLRAFLFETIGNADIDGTILVANMEAVFHWIKNGAAQQSSPSGRPCGKYWIRGLMDEDISAHCWSLKRAHGAPTCKGSPANAMEGRRDDTGKDPWHLFPWDAARCIVKVLGFGARKYAPRNWEKAWRGRVRTTA